ncbi:tetratricopeptide repeat protein [Mesorhizobium sp.]|uniref:tetratricopeptide repeat protein n=1 Tax=Mesorhizobium sp. TaxID=1871066 RepID=UPI0025799500|nr:tetratricopeptide repeat protein [Mesorhizobium sp.]
MGLNPVYPQEWTLEDLDRGENQQQGNKKDGRPAPEIKGNANNSAIENPETDASSVAECDRLAGHPSDKGLPSRSVPVEFERIDPEIAIPACRAALNQNPNHTRTLFQLGRAVAAAKDYGEARKLYERAAELGYAPALTNLGGLYRDGEGVTQDFGKAKELFERAAELDYAPAMAVLGSLYYHGQGVTQDFGKAKELFERAAELDYAPAIADLGRLYYHGQGVTQDFGKAKEFFDRGAALDDAQAITNLGILYQNGQGVSRDIDRARELYERASALGFWTAALRLGYLYLDGLGGERDYEAARKTFQKADPIPAGHLADSSQPTPAEALAFLATNASCNPPSRRYNEDPPFAHMEHQEERDNHFVGSFMHWIFAEEISNFAYNNTFDYSERLRRRIDWSKVYVSRTTFDSLDGRVELSSNKITLRCREPNCFNYTLQYMNPNYTDFSKDGTSSSQTYSFCSDEMAGRIAKAVEFMITLHGGKASPF